MVMEETRLWRCVLVARYGVILWGLGGWGVGALVECVGLMVVVLGRAF